MIRRSRCLLIGLLALLLVAAPVLAAARPQKSRDTSADSSSWGITRFLVELLPRGFEPLDCLIFGDCSPGIDPNGTPSGASVSKVKKAGPRFPAVLVAPGEKLQNS